MASVGPYLGDTMAISISTQGGTNIPVGSTQSLAMRVEVNEIEYFSADTSLREAVQHTEKVPVVEFTVGSWDILLHKHWLGGSGTSSTGLVDTSDPTKFDITGEVTGVGASTKEEVQITGVTLPTLPMFTANRNEFIGLDLTGRGEDVSILTEPT